MPHRSVLDNIAMPLEIRGINKNQRLETAQKMLSMVELDGWANKFAHELSGGMQQLVGLARTLAADPEILLMDEPFSALDPLIRRPLQNEIMTLAAVMKKTTVFITHDLDEAVRIGDRIAIMLDGKVIQVGTAEDYVAEFVACISRLKIVKAHAVMRPATEELSVDAIEFDETTNLSTLITAVVEENPVIVVIDSSAKRIGMIKHTDLLRTVIEGGEMT